MGFGIAAARPDASVLSIGIGKGGAEIEEMSMAHRDMESSNHISASREILATDFAASLRKKAPKVAGNLFDVGVISNVQAIVESAEDAEEAMLPHELEELIGVFCLFLAYYI